jgi:hypothetical protein
MPLPSFTVTADVNRMLPALTAGELTEVPLAGVQMKFTSNVRNVDLLVWDDQIYLPPDPVTVTIADDGTLAGDGDPIKLLANDAGLNVPDIEWTATLKIPGRSMRGIEFYAPADGETIDLFTVVPSPTTVGGSVGNTTSVIVTTGNEARPSALVVLWVDMRDSPATPPVNRGDNDLWFSPNTGTSSSADTTAPSVPTGLTSSAITNTTFTATWSASTDDVAVTGYEVRPNTLTVAVSISGLTHTFTGLTPATSYSWQVRSFDAAGNFSSWATVSSPAVTNIVPTPFSDFDFHEGSGTETTSLVSSHTLVPFLGASAWGPSPGIIDGEFKGKPAFTVSPEMLPNWSIRLDFETSSLSGAERSVFAGPGSIYVNIDNAGRLIWYNAADTVLQTSTGAVAVDTPYILVVAYSSTGRKLYLNGTPVLTSSTTQTLNTDGWLSDLPDSPANHISTRFTVWRETLSDAAVAAMT